MASAAILRYKYRYKYVELSGKGVCVGGGGVLNYLMDFCFSLECYDVKIDNRMLRTDNKYITLNIKCLK